MSYRGRPQRVVYVRQPIYDPDPDPDPDPIAITSIIFVALLLAGATTAGLSVTNPSFFSQLLVTINPSIKDLAEKQVKQQEEFWRNIMIIVLAICAIVLILFIWRYMTRRKEQKKAIRRMRNYRNKSLRMLRR